MELRFFFDKSKVSLVLLTYLNNASFVAGIQ